MRACPAEPSRFSGVARNSSLVEEVGAEPPERGDLRRVVRFLRRNNDMLVLSVLRMRAAASEATGVASTFSAALPFPTSQPSTTSMDPEAPAVGFVSEAVNDLLESSPVRQGPSG